MFLFDDDRAASQSSILIGETVFLRPPVAADFKAWATLREQSRPHLTRWEQDWRPDELSETAFRRGVRLNARARRAGSAISLLVFRTSDSAMVGGTGLSHIRYGALRSATLGYWTGAPYLRRGYAQVAIGALVSYGVFTLGLNRIEAACQPNNTPSKSLLLKLGFSKEGCARQYLKINGDWRDHELYAITASDLS